MKDYAVYKGDKFITLGSAQHCADFLSINKSTIYFYATPSYHGRSNKIAYEHRYIIFRIEDD